MKKTILKVAVAAVAIGSFALVPPLQSFAMDALSVFRVDSLQTIKISVADLQQGMQSAASLKNDVSQMKFDKNSFVNVVNAGKPESKVISNIRDFDAFEVNLPKQLKNETPELNAIGASKATFTLKADDCNAMLQVVKSPQLLPDVLKTEELGVDMPATLVAKYDDSVFVATQMPVLNASQEAKDAIKNLGLQIPMLPDGIRQQLAAIDVNSRAVYLPVLVGVGREVDLGGNTGYVYTLSDFKQFAGALPADMFNGLTGDQSKIENNSSSDDVTLTDEQKQQLETLKQFMNSQNGSFDETTLTAEQKQQFETLKQIVNSQDGSSDKITLTDEQKQQLEKLQQEAVSHSADFENASVLIWTKDGVLYGVAGNKTDGELVKIARSVN